jgi:hypothetical protein
MIADARDETLSKEAIVAELVGHRGCSDGGLELSVIVSRS